MEPKQTVINKGQIVECIEGLRTAMMNAYPGYLELPDWEPAFLLLEEKLSL